MKQIYGSIKHPNQAFAYETQGIIFTKQGKFDSAKESFEIALDILSDVLGDKNDHEITKRIKKSKDVLWYIADETQSVFFVMIVNVIWKQ